MVEEQVERSQPDERTALLGNDGRRIPKPDDVEPDNRSSDENDDVSSQSTTPEEAELSTGELALTLSGGYIGVFLAALDTTIIAVISGPISSEFSSSRILSVLVSAYLIANAGFQPISGKISDIYGRKACLLVAVLLFGAGNLICGLAKSETAIILGRVVSGIGGGCINTITSFLASDLIPLKRRGVWQGFGNIAFGMGGALGGVFGGLMNDLLDWRWAFLVQVPITALSGIIIYWRVNLPAKEGDKSRIRRVDFLGAFTLVAALALLLLGLNSGGNLVPWRHPLVYVSIPLSAILLAAFVYIEDRIASEPIIPVRLLLDRTVASACFLNLALSMAYFMYIYYAPIYFQVRGLNSTQVGERTIPNAIGIAVGSFGSGFVMRATGKYYWLSVATQVTFLAACLLVLLVFNINMPDWPPFVILFLGGVGYASMLTTTLLALIAAVDQKHQAVITSASYAARSSGSTIGIAIAGSIFQNVVSNRLWEVFDGDKGRADIVNKLLDDISYIQKLHGTIKVEVVTAYMDALRGVWGAMLGIAVLGAIASLFMREHTLHANLARK